MRLLRRSRRRREDSLNPIREPYQRNESEAHRLDRNYGELLQELRVAQTGVQILFAFLLGIPFQQRFTTLSDAQVDLYLVTLISSAAAAVLLIAPVAAHRVLFRRHRKDELVVLTARLAALGLGFLAVAIGSAVLLIVSVVASWVAAAVVVAVLAVTLLATWVLLPVAVRKPAGPLGTDPTPRD